MKKILILSIVIAVLLTAGCVAAYNEPPNTPRPVKGAENPVVVITEYSDFECPACGQAYLTVENVMKKYGDRVQLEFKHYPLTTIHPNAFNAAMASECANDQGKFWEMHDELFKNQKALDRSSLIKHAGTVGLDTELFTACFDSQAKSDEVNADLAEAKQKRLRGTPSFFMDGEQVSQWNLLESFVAQKLDTE